MIDLNFNGISHIDDNAFLPCAALSILKMSHNRLSSLPPTLGPNSPYLSELTITNIPSCVIGNSWFMQFGSLETLFMEDIGMREFPNDFFTGLVSLTHLHISQSTTPNLTERAVSLEHLGFDDHMGSTFPDKNILNMKNLKRVSMRKGDDMTSWPRFLGATALKNSLALG